MGSPFAPCATRCCNAAEPVAEDSGADMLVQVMWITKRLRLPASATAGRQVGRVWMKANGFCPGSARPAGSICRTSSLLIALLEVAAT
jgi:hypothetical protein